MKLPFLRAKETDAPRKRAAAAPAAVGPVEVARTQARRRLVGALVLLVAGVIGFPWLFETQPRPLPMDTPMLLPEGGAARPAGPSPVRPLPNLPADAGNEGAPGAAGAAPAAPAASAPIRPESAVQAVVTGAASVPQPTAAPQSLAVAPTKIEPKAEPKAEPKFAAKIETRAEIKPAPEAVPASKTLKAAAAASATAAEGAALPRFVVQVGAYNDKAREDAARQKLEKLGLKSYTQVVDTPSGKRTRVRAGPFASRQEADAAVSKIKASGMQANLLSL